MPERIADRINDAILSRLLEIAMGKSRDDLIGKLATEVFGPGDPRRLELYGQVLSEGRPARVETHCPFTNRDFDVSVSPMPRLLAEW